MNISTSALTPETDQNWHLLGKLEIPVSVSVEHTLYVWLREILQPLYLQAELLDQIIVSAQGAIARAIHSETTLKFDYVHLKVFIPSERGERKQAWGFFRLEKFEPSRENDTDGKHAVEFYLYWEGV